MPQLAAAPRPGACPLITPGECPAADRSLGASITRLIEDTRVHFSDQLSSEMDGCGSNQNESEPIHYLNSPT